MNKLKASILKELLLLFSDRIGLFFMFFMPIFLVFIITIIQNSAYEIINENKISLHVSNQDEGVLGDSLISLLEKSKMFSLTINNEVAKENLSKNLLDNKMLTSVFIPKEFSNTVITKAEKSTDFMLYQMGINDSISHFNIHKNEITFVYDPILQENYVKSIESILFQFISLIENTSFIEEIFTQVGIDNESSQLKSNIFEDQISIRTQHAILSSGKTQKPNATQHNIPAWTIFAMFFMVVSLASNIVKEKNNGSFVRLKTMPTSILTTLSSKMIVYIFAAFLQVVIIFLIGIYIFPLIDLPRLGISANIFTIFMVVLLSSLAAVSWAVFIGTFAKTQEQAAGVGAISIIIFAAIGGVWVPTFVMPPFMQFLSNFSPMNWCLEAFYTLLLKNGNFKELLITFVYILVFVISLQTISFLKLRKDKLI